MIFLHIYQCKDNTKAFSRKILLQNLSLYLGKKIQDINIEYNENGKPHVKDLFFSVSHCRDKITHVFTKGSEVGIDIEFKNQKRAFLKLAERYFHPNEFEYLNSLPNDEAMHLFYNLWTAKESVCKAYGGRLWYYLADNHLNKNLKMSRVIKGMYVQSLQTITDYSLSIASVSKIENIEIIENV